ncbi:hypothetical protein DYE50_07945 [Treponema ruminis]|uniref:Lipoprotein n=1 Tax=Treponema ruminis TaxID=744515 RepID=A0A7W8G8S1_9SPIR|nr:hypothetical protein [Treponema ruminis]MBB5225809.1 hypothetical protein [Treponema ruminis]QSI02498.1 hypothetical protein DYE50_07945 [Treponema ruminis]
MKKSWITCVSLVAAAAVLMFASCSNISEGDSASYYSKNGASAKAEKTLVATVNGITSIEAVQSQVASRTVLPEPQAIDTGLVYVLEGKSSIGGKIDAKSVTVNAGSETGTGTVTISFPDTSIWELTLTAYKDSAVASAATHVQEKEYSAPNTANGAAAGSTVKKYAYNPVLTATTEVSLVAGSPKITFNMNVKGLETPGTVAIGANPSDDSKKAGFVYTGKSVKITHYEIALYDRISGAAILNKAEPSVAATTGKVEVTPTAGNVDFSADSTSLANVAPGEYVLGVAFYNNYNEVDYQVGFWSDYVVVAPGQTTTFSELITGIDEKPKAPENFTAELVANSEVNGTFLAKLTWEDKATNENNYEIDLYEVNDDAAKTALTVETIKTAANATKLATLGFSSHYDADTVESDKIVDFKDGSLYYGGGSLFASSEEATLKLDTGKLYEVVIRAVKSANDKSDDVARTATADFTAANHINRVRISYITAPYTIKVGSKEGQQYVTYHTFKGDEIALLADAKNGFTLSYKGTDVPAENFKGWISAADGESSVSAATYKNVNVLADIAVDFAATLKTYSYSTDVTSDFVALKSFTNSADSTGTDVNVTGNVATVNAKANERLSVSAVDADSEYSGYVIAVDGYLYTQEQACTLYLSRLATGTHNILVAGEKADGSGKTTLYSYSFTLKVER